MYSRANSVCTDSAIHLRCLRDYFFFFFKRCCRCFCVCSLRQLSKLPFFFIPSSKEWNRSGCLRREKKKKIP